MAPRGDREDSSARRYHEATKHSVASVRGDPHFLDWENQPIPFKVFTGLEASHLPQDFAPSERPALEAIADAGEASGDGPSFDRALLAHLFYFTAGIVRRRAFPGGEAYFRAAACTGNLHHIELYLVCGPLADLEAGVYHFGAHDFSLRRLREGDHRAHLIDATGGEPRIAGAPAVLAFSTTFWRNAWKYRARAYRHAFWDSGTLLANLLAVSAARAVPAHLVLGFVDEPVNRLLDLDVEREVALGLVALGRGAGGEPPPAAPPIAPLALETLPLSAHEVDYPAIRETHRAARLETPAEVTEWRDSAIASLATAQSQLEQPASTRLAPLALATAAPEPIESVILRRGSARVFERAAIGRDQLATVLAVATRGFSSDFVPPRELRSELYVIVNAVDELAPGSYVYDRERAELLLLRAGDFRREAGFLGLGQEIPADAAVNLYWLADLDPILERLGNRGYRAAHLEAAIGGGRTYLAAYALRLGASGLTFFDDDVTRFFSPHAAGKSVLFLMAIGVPRRLRRAAGRG